MLLSRQSEAPSLRQSAKHLTIGNKPAQPRHGDNTGAATIEKPIPASRAPVFGHSSQSCLLAALGGLPCNVRLSLNELKEKWVAQATALWMRARASTGPAHCALPWWRRWPTRREWLWFAAALPVLFVVYVLLLIPFTPSISDIRKAKLEQPAQILSADGKLIGEFKRSNRQWVPLEQISPAVVKALVATEDHRFYEHHGMDFTRTVGSVIHTLGGNPQGGSTITQQLARNLYPTEIGRARNVNRKLKEAITAFKIEALYTKDEILETYLNTVPFLYNAYGIEMAARTYFDKPAPGSRCWKAPRWWACSRAMPITTR
jgi:penicillin-binding protein 1A